MIFIDLFIIKFIVINVQIGRVLKHGSKTFMIKSIPCPTILNDIFFSEIGTCKKNGNLMFMQVSTQRPFTCATNILGERKWDLICHIWMLLVLYNPCMASFFQIICRNPILAKCGGEAQHSQSWGLGVLRDSRMFRVRQQGPKHLELRCS